jgi:hypothetical protein
VKLRVALWETLAAKENVRKMLLLGFPEEKKLSAGDLRAAVPAGECLWHGFKKQTKPISLKSFPS